MGADFALFAWFLIYRVTNPDTHNWRMTTSAGTEADYKFAGTDGLFNIGKRKPPRFVTFCSHGARRNDGDETGTYSKSVMAFAGISSLEKANIFFPKSFSEAPMWYTSVPSIIRKRS